MQGSPPQSLGAHVRARGDERAHLFYVSVFRRITQSTIKLHHVPTSRAAEAQPGSHLES